MSEPPDMMTKQEVAGYLKVSLRTVSRHVPASGKVGRMPRYTKADVDAFVASSRRETSNVRRTPRGVLRVTVASAGDLEADLQALKTRLRRNRVQKRD